MRFFYVFLTFFYTQQAFCGLNETLFAWDRDWGGIRAPSPSVSDEMKSPAQVTHVAVLPIFALKRVVGSTYFSVFLTPVPNASKPIAETGGAAAAAGQGHEDIKMYSKSTHTLPFKKLGPGETTVQALCQLLGSLGVQASLGKFCLHPDKPSKIPPWQLAPDSHVFYRENLIYQACKNAASITQVFFVPAAFLNPPKHLLKGGYILRLTFHEKIIPRFVAGCLESGLEDIYPEGGRLKDSPAAAAGQEGVSVPSSPKKHMFTEYVGFSAHTFLASLMQTWPFVFQDFDSAHRPKAGTPGKLWARVVPEWAKPKLPPE